jgi:hypothetical protein
MIPLATRARFVTRTTSAIWLRLSRGPPVSQIV